MKIDDYIDVDEPIFEKARQEKYIDTRLFKRKYDIFKYHKIIVDEGITIIQTVSKYIHEKMENPLRKSRVHHRLYQHRYHPLKHPEINKISDYLEIDDWRSY